MPRSEGCGHRRGLVLVRVSIKCLVCRTILNLPPHGLRQTIAIGIGVSTGCGISGVISSPSATSGALPFVSG